MSHKATNWAIQQRGLAPACKLLLWQLADRHNADTGRCDPSQDRLAEDCEMSRATVNRHLKKLESAGLIRRVPRLDPKTKRQISTSYLLAFDCDLSVSQDETQAVSQMEPDPCLNSEATRVSNCDTNLGSEPGKEPGRRASALDDPISILSKVVDKQTAQAFIEHRNALRAKLTHQGARLIVGKLKDRPEHERKACIEASIENGWRGVFPPDAKGKAQAKDPTIAWLDRREAVQC